MATKATQQVRVNTTRYLDEEGLEILWEKIKAYVDEHSVTIEGDDISLTGYVTVEQLEEALANIDTSDIDLSAYQTKEELAVVLRSYAKTNHIHSEYLTEHQDISGKADVEHTHTMSDITDYTEPDLTSYATKTYVTDAINNASLSGGEGTSVDLSIYATKEELSGKADADHTHDQYLTEHQSLEGYATEKYVENALKNAEIDVDLTDYALKSELPDLTSYATKNYVDTAIENVEAGDVNLDGYATEEFVRDSIANAQLNGGMVEDEYEEYSLEDNGFTRIEVDLPTLPTYNGRTMIYTNGGSGTEMLVNVTDSEILNLDEYGSAYTVGALETDGSNVRDYLIAGGDDGSSQLITAIDIDSAIPSTVKKTIYKHDISFYTYHSSYPTTTKVNHSFIVYNANSSTINFGSTSYITEAGYSGNSIGGYTDTITPIYVYPFRGASNVTYCTAGNSYNVSATDGSTLKTIMLSDSNLHVAHARFTQYKGYKVTFSSTVSNTFNVPTDDTYWIGVYNTTNTYDDSYNNVRCVKGSVDYNTLQTEANEHYGQYLVQLICQEVDENDEPLENSFKYNLYLNEPLSMGKYIRFSTEQLYKGKFTFTSLLEGYGELYQKYYDEGGRLSIADWLEEIHTEKNTSGVSPTFTVTKVNGVATLTCTDINGTTSVTIYDGSDGADGSNGTDGVTPDLTGYLKYQIVTEVPDTQEEGVLYIVTG